MNLSINLVCLEKTCFAWVSLNNDVKEAMNNIAVHHYEIPLSIKHLFIRTCMPSYEATYVAPPLTDPIYLTNILEDLHRQMESRCFSLYCL